MFRNKKSKALVKPDPSSQSKRIHPAVAFIEILKTCDKIFPELPIIVFSLEAERCTNHFIRSVQKHLDKSYAGSSLQKQISFVDLSGLIDSSHRFILDPHLNAKGHQVVAEALSKHLEQFIY